MKRPFSKGIILEHYCCFWLDFGQTLARLWPDSSATFSPHLRTKLTMPDAFFVGPQAKVGFWPSPVRLGKLRGGPQL
jgi:hypothetical protein